MTNNIVIEVNPAMHPRQRAPLFSDLPGTPANIALKVDDQIFFQFGNSIYVVSEATLGTGRSRFPWTRH